MKVSGHTIVMMGATGAVGTEVVKSLANLALVEKISLLGRGHFSSVTSNKISQHKINIFEPNTYHEFVPGHDVAICTLGVGRPTKMSKEEFIRIDKDAVVDFAKVCKKSGVKHFELLASVGPNSKSKSLYLRSKGELIEELIALNFERLSVFQPSMILTPYNRYGFSQWLTLKIWPHLDPILSGKRKKYRGISVEKLGEAIAKNIGVSGDGIEYLHWDEFQVLSQS